MMATDGQRIAAALLVVSDRSVGRGHGPALTARLVAEEADLRPEVVHRELLILVRAGWLTADTQRAVLVLTPGGRRHAQRAAGPVAAGGSHG
jgi:DNA-binding IclR family transcriptional regulator